MKLSLLPSNIEIKPVDLANPIKILKICLNMQILCEQEHGIGLAAPQVEIAEKLFIVKKNDKYRYFLNCTYEPVSDKKIISLEGCLSLRDDIGRLRYFQIERCPEIRLLGKELIVGSRLQILDIDVLMRTPDSIVIQHEIDHCNHVLISDIGHEVLLQTD